eukprot:3943901-Amphidinium_carterae.1
MMLWCVRCCCRGFNVCEGPSYQVINRLFNTKAKGKEMTEFMSFHDEIAPQPKFGMRSQEHHPWLCAGMHAWLKAEREMPPVCSRSKAMARIT